VKRSIAALAVVAAIGVSTVVVIAVRDDPKSARASSGRPFDRTALDRQASAQAEQQAAAQDALAEQVAARGSASAPRSFREREELPSCGHLALTSVRGLDPRTFDCLVSPGAQGTELIVLRRTVEGDPVVRYYRAVPGIEGIEVFSDDTLDSFGTTGWSRRVRTLDQLAKLGI
jgi:hypothetical protein